MRDSSMQDSPTSLSNTSRFATARRGFTLRSLATVFVLLATAMGAWGCRGAGPEADAPPQPRLVLLYATCTLNNSFLSPYNPDVAFTPRLARLAAEGLVFERHRTEVGMSGVAYASILAGGQAPHHGVFSHPKELFDSVEVIAEAFARDGYETFFWSRQGMASAELNYGQGIPSENVIADILRGDDERFQEILARLGEDPDYKAFVFANFTITHAPYVNLHLDTFCEAHPAECEFLSEMGDGWVAERYALLHDNYRSFQFNFPEFVDGLGWTEDDIAQFARFVSILYRSNVYWLDRMFGRVVRFVDRAGLRDETMVIFTADHGETMYRPADLFHWSHAASLEAEVLDVPLIIRAPGQGVIPGRVEFVTRSIDLFPTIAGLAGVSAPDLPASASITGIDLSNAILGEEEGPDLAAYSHTAVFPTKSLRRHAPEMKLFFEYFAEASIETTWVALREDDTVLKYRHSLDGGWKFEAYDLATDPAEENDIYDAADPTLRSMTERLRRYKVDLVEAYADWQELRGTTPDGLSEEDLRRLRSLGYIQ
jgi:arylsulfatase A-like enzyme